jgi:predicted outer membrane repeat protein
MERRKQSAIAVIICIAVSNLCTAAPGKIIYVDDDANGLGSGSSWQSAYKYLRDALADANDSAEPIEVRVAQGTYKPDQGMGVRARDYKATFQLINGVALKGGYAGLAEADPNMRDIKLYESILSGDLGNDDPDVNETADLLSCFVGPNSDAIVTGSGTDNTATLDGFTVTAGHHYLDSYPDCRPGSCPPPPPLKGWGAGMNNCTGSPTVMGCTFVGNMTTFSGAGMCNVEGSHPLVVDCMFVDNYAVGGGALANWNDSSPVLTRCTFRKNVAGREGGAVHSHRSSPTFSDCTFVCNTVRLTSSEGGAIYDDTSISTLTDCTFAENEAASGGAIHSHDNDNLSLERCTFVGNLAGTGGAISGWGRNNSFVVNACTFSRNLSRGGAGAIYSYGKGQLSDCTFSANTSRGFAGAVNIRTGTFSRCLFLGNRALDNGAGGAVYSGGSIEPLHFINCTFIENHARWGSAVWIWTGEPTEFRNCIVRGPQPLIWADPSEPQPQVTYCDIEHTWPGEGNIDVDPLFAKTGHWVNSDDPNSAADPNSPNAVRVDGDYHLKSQAGRWDPNSQSWVKDAMTSPCIDAGDPNSPVGEELEPNGGRINMGAYGGTAEASKSYFGEPVTN